MQSNDKRLPDWIRRIKSEKVLPMKSPILVVCGIGLATLVFGWVFTTFLVQFSESGERDHFIAETINAAAVFDHRQILSLQGKPEDADTSNYQNLLQWGGQICR